MLKSLLCISVKLKNLKANHNCGFQAFFLKDVVYIRKVKKSESKSQRHCTTTSKDNCCVYP